MSKRPHWTTSRHWRQRIRARPFLITPRNICRNKFEKYFKVNLIFCITLIDNNSVNETINNIFADVLCKVKFISDT